MWSRNRTRAMSGKRVNVLNRHIQPLLRSICACVRYAERSRTVAGPKLAALGTRAGSPLVGRRGAEPLRPPVAEAAWRPPVKSLFSASVGMSVRKPRVLVTGAGAEASGSAGIEMLTSVHLAVRLRISRPSRVKMAGDDGSAMAPAARLRSTSAAAVATPRMQSLHEPIGRGARLDRARATSASDGTPRHVPVPTPAPVVITDQVGGGGDWAAIVAANESATALANADAYTARAVQMAAGAAPAGPPARAGARAAYAYGRRGFHDQFEIEYL